MRIDVDARSLRELSVRLRDLNGSGRRRLENDLRDYAWSSHYHDTMAGLDRHGRPLEPWRVRTGAYAGLTGPTLAAHGSASNRLSGFFFKLTNTLGGFSVDVGFESKSPLMARVFRWHAEGKAGTGRKGQVTGIVRDILGMPPERIARITAMVREYYQRGARYGR